VTPAPPDNTRAGRHVDMDLKNAIVVHVPKTKRVRIVLLKDDPEADQFAWEIDAFLRAEGYTVVPRLFFAMAPGGTTPVGTSMYPDEKDANVIVIRIGLNDRS
jgi:predicted CoA-binding protein